MKAGWPITRLGDLSVVQSGGTPKRTEAKFWHGDIPWYSSGELNGVTTRPNEFITEGGLAGSNAKLLPKGSLLIGMYDTAAMKMARLDRDAAFNQAVAGVWPKEGVDLRFVQYCLEAQKPKVMAQRRGTRQKNLSLAKIKSLPIPLPPLEEQQRIVAILDEAFEGLDRAKANAEANLASAREIYLSALRSVFDNRSTKWSNDAASDIFEPDQCSSVTASRSTTKTGGRDATPRPIPGNYSLSVLDAGLVPRAGWRWTPLNKLARMESGHTPSRRKPEYWGGEVPWIGIKDARAAHGRVIAETLEQTNDLGVANSSTRILPAGTVCLSRTASVGYVTVMGRPMATSQDFVNWVCSDALEPEFLMHLLVAQGDEVLRFASGSVHQTIYFPEAKAFQICHPPISVQREICSLLHDISERASGLIEAKGATSRELDHLRQSLLAKAFTGELT